MASAWFLILIVLRLFDPPKQSIHPDGLGRSKIDGMAAILTVLVWLAIEEAVAVSAKTQTHYVYHIPVIVLAMQAVAYAIEPSIYVSKLDWPKATYPVFRQFENPVALPWNLP